MIFSCCFVYISTYICTFQVVMDKIETALNYCGGCCMFDGMQLRVEFLHWIGIKLS